MDAFAVPGDVLAVLTAAGLRPARSLGPAAWLVAPADDAGDLLELHVVALAFDEHVVARAAALTALAHEHLPRVRSVMPLGPGRSGLLVAHVVGTSLARLRAARPPLSDGEAVTLTVPLAGALAALHRAGLAHGAVGPDAVVVDPDGRPVLTHLHRVLLATGSPDDDLRRLLATVLDVLPGADVDVLAERAATATVRDELEALLASPAVTADAVVERCFAAAAPEPVGPPDAGALAWADAADVVERAGGPSERVAREAVTAAASRRERRVVEGGRRRRRRSAPGRRSVWRAVAGGVAVCLAVVGLAAAHEAWAGDGRVPATRADGPVDADPARDDPARDDPATVAVRLTQARAAALAAVDARALTSVDAPGSPALAADLALVRALGTAHLDGVRVQVSARPSVAPGPAWAAVVVTSATSAYGRVESDGSRTQVPAGPPRTVVLDLRRTPDGWRVWDVRGR
ncbi:serine/threonine-protein kinase [Cellulomonas alba]|uniref:Protein kinase domain-containing protein n=1 Tax=Cellulomonas alba TaxID=3053467 RepID=A0ABT7SDJ1_9CELL|nr:hypothetical protein [Cellulomonas alba]MDM7853637.1 hypothetical protein [Cellulomonas alba]